MSGDCAAVHYPDSHDLPIRPFELDRPRSSCARTARSVPSSRRCLHYWYCWSTTASALVSKDEIIEKIWDGRSFLKRRSPAGSNRHARSLAMTARPALYQDNPSSGLPLCSRRKGRAGWSRRPRMREAGRRVGRASSRPSIAVLRSAPSEPRLNCGIADACARTDHRAVTLAMAFRYCARVLVPPARVGRRHRRDRAPARCTVLPVWRVEVAGASLL